MTSEDHGAGGELVFAPAIPPVPNWAIGLWQRRQLETGDGSLDRTSCVLWLQTDTLFGDLRIAAPSITIEPRLRHGFAGELRVAGQKCEWIRELDTHPSGGPADAGAVFICGERMIECGLHENYLEHWDRVSTTLTPRVALRRTEKGATSAILVVCGAEFILAQRAHGRPTSAQAPLCHVTYGNVRGANGHWIAQHSTSVETEGRQALPAATWKPISPSTIAETTDQTEGSRLWQVASSTIPIAELCDLLAGSLTGA